jgi:hypothetical protein
MSITPAVTETAYALIGANLGPFATVWPYSADSDVEVYVDFANGAGPQLQGGGNYTLVDLIPLSTGGNVTLAAALLPGAGAWAAGSVVILKRGTPASQPSTFGELNPFSPSAMESAIDNLARQIQDVAASLARALLFPLGGAGATLPDVSVRAGQILGFDAGGNPTVLPPSAPNSLTLLTLPGLIPVAIATALQSGGRYYGTQIGGVTHTLPAPAIVPDYAVVEFWSGANAAANPIIFQVAGGGNIVAAGVISASVEINTNNIKVTFAKFGGVWNVIGS